MSEEDVFDKWYMESQWGAEDHYATIMAQEAFKAGMEAERERIKKLWPSEEGLGLFLVGFKKPPSYQFIINWLRERLGLE